MAHGNFDGDDMDDDECRECAERARVEREGFKRGEQTQGDLFGLTHRSTWPRRLRTDGPERIFYQRWIERNRRERILHHILRGEEGDWMEPTDRDSIVAASVVQWLGTNCGRGFINGCEREIGWTDSMVYRPFTKDASVEERARAILAPLRDQPGYGAAVVMLAATLQKEKDSATAEIERVTNNAVKAVTEAIATASAEIERIRKDAIFGFESGGQRKIQRGIALKKP